MSQISRFEQPLTIAACIGVITGTIVLSKADAWFYYPAKRSEQPVYVPNSVAPVQNPQVYNPRARIDRQQFAKFAYGHYAPGQTTRAMRSALGAPYASIPQSNVEFYPFNHDPETWAAFQYDRNGRYVGYSISARNSVVNEPTISQVIARGDRSTQQQQAFVQPARAYTVPTYQQPSSYVQQRNTEVCGRFPMAVGCGRR
jgi:hypothetical protein